MGGYGGRHRGGRYGMSYGGDPHSMMAAGDEEGNYGVGEDRAEESKFQNWNKSCQRLKAPY